MSKKVRVPTTLLRNGVYREDMNWEEERGFVLFMYDKYEKAGFNEHFFTDRKLPPEFNNEIGKGYKLLKRMEVPNTPEEEGEKMPILDLPAWEIEFADGKKLVAYPEEICALDVSKMNAC